jgi:protocatechuate 3,4-dioxygenase beta subunit
MRTTISRILKVVLLISIGMAATGVRTLHAAIPQQAPAINLRGRVADARTGEPIAKVRVIVSGTDLSTTTDDNGEFTFDNVSAGQVDLYISN